MSAPHSSACSVDESARREFESAWRTGQAQPIEQFLPDQSSDLYLPTLEELVHIDLEFGWKVNAGRPLSSQSPGSGPPLVEHYLSRFSPLNEPHILLRLLKQECAVRRQCGQAPTESELRRRFPAPLLDNDLIQTLVARGEAQAAPPASPGSAPDELARYSLLNEHASGGFGTVWRATDSKLSRQVAVKQLRERLTSEPEIRKRFAREARICARLEHPGVVPVYDAGNLDGGRPFYAMKFIQGETLADAIARFHKIPRRDESRRLERIKLLTHFLSVVRTMEYAHSRGVIHRDLKPQNVVLGDFGEAYVVDWGLAKVLDEKEPETAAAESSEVPSDMAVTQPGTVQGTPAYMSPEQAAGNVAYVDEQSDLYALGAMLYQILTGKLPIEGESRDGILEQVLIGEPPRPRSIDGSIHPGLEAICQKAMAKQKRGRYQTAAELTRDLQSFLADEPVSAFREPWTSRLARWGRRRRTLVVTSGVALLLIALGGGVLAYLSERAALRLGESVRGDQALAQAEIHAGRLDSAQSLLGNAVSRLEKERRFGDVRSDLQAQLGRVQTLTQFWRHADQAWFQAGEEREAESLEACTSALADLGIEGEGEWWRKLPTQDLTKEQQTEVADEIHRLYLLQASLLTKNAVVKFNDPAGKQDCQQALVALRQAQKFRPSNYSRLVENFCYFRLGEQSKITSLKGIEPSAPDDYFFFGFIYIWLGQYPDNAESKLIKTMVRSLFGLEFENPLQKGQAYFKKAAELQPHRFWHHFMVGWAESVSGDFAQAELAFTTCVALRPKYSPGYVGRGSMKITQGRRAGEKARVEDGYADFETAIQLDPHDSWTYFSRAELADEPHFEQAVQDYQRAMELERPSSRGTFQVHRLDEVCKSVLGKNPGNPDVHATRAWAHWRRGAAKEALESAEQALKLDSGNTPALVLRGRLRQEEKKWDDALADFQATLAKEPTHFAALLGKAQALEGKKKPEEALAAYAAAQKGTALDWQISAAKAGSAQVLRKLGRNAEAEQQLKNNE